MYLYILDVTPASEERRTMSFLLSSQAGKPPFQTDRWFTSSVQYKALCNGKNEYNHKAQTTTPYIHRHSHHVPLSTYVRSWPEYDQEAQVMGKLQEVIQISFSAKIIPVWRRLVVVPWNISERKAHKWMGLYFADSMLFFKTTTNTTLLVL